MGATTMADIEMLDQLEPVLGNAPSGSTVRRVLALAADSVLVKIAQARARTGKHVRGLIEDAGGFPGSLSRAGPWKGGSSWTWTAP
jgi:hypothetical protein